MEAMRSTEAGAWEYQLDAAARYVFLLNGARLDGYRSITASGTEQQLERPLLPERLGAASTATWC